MSLGNAWTETTAGSASKLNQVTLTYGSGTYLATLSKTEHKLVACTSTGSGFTLDHIYLANAAADTWIDLSDTDVHYHTDETDGGSIINILRASPNIFDTSANLLTRNIKSKWTETVSGTGVITDDTDGNQFIIKLDTGATNASVASIKQAGIQFNASKRSFFKTLVKFGTATSVATKIGFGAESLASADDNTRKYGAEVCTTVNNNWFSFSANGTTRSSSDTGTAITANQVSLRLEHYPDTPNTELYIDEGTVYSKTSNIPTTNASDEPTRDAIFRITLKNNTGASRTLNNYGVRFAYETTSTWK